MPLVRDEQGGPHSLAGLLPPRDGPGIDPGRRPEGQLLLLGAGAIAARHERPRPGNPSHRLHRVGEAADAGRVVGRTDEQEVVMHHQPPVHQVTAGQVLPLGLPGPNPIGNRLPIDR